MEKFWFYRRIAEVKANERNRALEEILYALVVQKFMDANVSLVPAITPSSTDSLGRVDTWPCQEDKLLVQLHSPEANEMIQNHLTLILGDRSNDLSSVAQSSKRMIGQVYAASAMYGYFLKRVDQRFQLEKTMKILPNAPDAEGCSIELAVREDIRPAGHYQDVSSRPEVSSWSGIISPEEYANLVKPSRLRTYVMSFDGETLQRFATIRSKEAVSIIEKHTEALFGRPGTVITAQETVGSSKDKRIKISFGGLKRLVLEAVTFGSFLWDVESFVDSRYHFVLPLAHTIEHEESLEVIKLEGIAQSPEDALMPKDVFLLQLCSGMDENAVGTCAELIFAPIDASFGDDAPLLPSGFRIIPLDSGKEAPSPSRTLDLASALEIGPAGNKASNDYSTNPGCMRSVMTIAFEFAFESHLQEHVTAMARQYVRSIISAVQRVASALSPSYLSSQAGLRTPLGTPEAQTLARWICQSYRGYMGVELLKSSTEGGESVLKTLWHHSDAIMCCSLKALPVFTFANQAGLDMLETTLVALQDLTLEKIFDEHGRKTLCTEFSQIMQQGFASLQGGICLSSMGRPVSYERALAWKVLNEEENAHCICFMFINWSFV